MTILVEAITKNNIFAHALRFIESESAMIIFTSFFSPLIWLVNPWAILIFIRQRFARKNRQLAQEEANRIMEPMAYQMGKRYAELVKLIWLVSFYESLIPICPPIAALGPYALLLDRQIQSAPSLQHQRDRFGCPHSQNYDSSRLFPGPQMWG